MKKLQYTRMKFSPTVGLRYNNISNNFAEHYRKELPYARWDYNPWTGELRNKRDVTSDPYGLAIAVPGEPHFSVWLEGIDS